MATTSWVMFSYLIKGNHGTLLWNLECVIISVCKHDLWVRLLLTWKTPPVVSYILKLDTLWSILNGKFSLFTVKLGYILLWHLRVWLRKYKNCNCCEIGWYLQPTPKQFRTLQPRKWIKWNYTHYTNMWVLQLAGKNGSCFNGSSLHPVKTEIWCVSYCHC